MKKLICLLSLIFCINLLSFSQIIREPVQEFGEMLLTLDKISAKRNITNRGFKLFSNEQLINLGHYRENLGKLIVGIGDRNINCKIELDKTERYVEKVTIGGIRYINTKYMINEYQSAGYVLDEKNSIRGELYFVKQTNKYTYFAFVEFITNPNMCMTISEFRRIVRK